MVSQGRNLSSKKAGMFPYAFTTKLVLPTPAPLNSPISSSTSSLVQQHHHHPQQQQQQQHQNLQQQKHQQQQQKPYYNRNNSINSQHSSDRQSQLNTYSVHDTLTDLDEAISELSGANQQQHQHSFSSSTSSQIPDVLNWQPLQVKNYFLSLGYEPSICECFFRHQINGSILLELDLAYLKEIDIPSFGTRFQISKVIKSLNQMVKTGVPEDPSAFSSNNNSHQSLSQSAPYDSPPSYDQLDDSNIAPQAQSQQTQHADSSQSQQQGLMPAPVFKRQSILRNAKDNTLLNDYLSKNPNQDYQQHQSQSQSSSAEALDFPLKNGVKHKKDSSFDRSWTVSKGQKPTEIKDGHKSLQAKQQEQLHQRLRSTTISTTDQYFHENRTSVDSNPGIPTASTSKPSYVEETRNRHGSIHSRQISSDTVTGGTSGSSGASDPSANDSSTLFSHKHSRSASSLGFSDFKYINKLTSDDAFNDEPKQHARRPSSIASVILTHDDGPKSKKEGANASESAVGSDSEADDDKNQSKRVFTDHTLSNSSIGSGERSDATSPSQSSKDLNGGSMTPTASGKKKKGSALRSSSSQSNLRKSSSKKSKTFTSAFQEGIKSVTPTEASKTADYSGWMSKRGSVAVGTWKSRFFTLHGTRLSYFAQFSDTREKGLIDITSHRVVAVGDDDKLVAMYAASVGAGRHCFKIVPPSPGSRKGVTFTVPKVHYFAVDSKEEMREWMNALMKATIDRDDSVPVVSSCATPTVSLARAREIFADSRAREDDLRAKALAESNSNLAQMVLGASITGNNSVSALANGNSNNGVSATAGTNHWLNGFGTNFYHEDVSSGSVSSSGNGNAANGLPSTPDSPTRSGSFKSSETGSSITGGSSVIVNKNGGNVNSGGALGSLGQGFGSGSLGINPAAISGALSADAKTQNTQSVILRHGKFSTEYPLDALPANLIASNGRKGSKHEVENHTGGLKLVTDLE